MDKKRILVTGATGQQGGAVACHLLAAGWPVRALVRDPEKDACLALQAQGAELFVGDLNDRASIDAALEGIYGVFSVQNFWLPDVGFEGEVRQGMLLADAAAAAGVGHFVYTSVAAAERGMGQRHFETKWQIEQHLATLDLPWTIVRPVAFMENYNWTRPQISNGVFQSWGIRPEKTLQTIAVDDIGGFVALVFEHPAEFIGKTVELAGDELTEAQMAEALSRVIGRPVHVEFPQMPEGFTPDPEQQAMSAFFNGESYTVDIPALRRRYPTLQTFEQYLRRSGWENLPVLPMPESDGGWG
jgi:uncharacterized protein YbjT (DUF2867 family)